MGLEAATLAAISVGVSAAGAVASGVMQMRQASQQSAVMRQQADFTRKQAAIDAEEFKRRQRRLLASARAGRGASGVDLLTGSPLMVDDDSIAEIVFQTERVRRTGEVQATRLDQQAQLVRSQGRGALGSSLLSAGGTLLGGFGGTSDPGAGAGGGALPFTNRQTATVPAAVGFSAF